MTTNTRGMVASRRSLISSSLAVTFAVGAVLVVGMTAYGVGLLGVRFGEGTQRLFALTGLLTVALSGVTVVRIRRGQRSRDVAGLLVANAILLAGLFLLFLLIPAVHRAP